jgi:L-amino acid N-acyltransferase YncA
MEVVECIEKYWESIRVLRNDERVLPGFIKSEYITKEMQIKYMKVNSGNYRVALFHGKFAGYIGVIENDIRICTHPAFQGRGMAKMMINECIDIWPNAFAKIKIKNEASIKLFESCGFMKKFYILTKE